MTRRDSPVPESENEAENDENTPVNDENIPPLLVFHTPALSRDTPLRDITDQFFHPPSPSPVKSKRSAPHTIEPPRRPKKPRSLAYPADPPNWLYSHSSSSLPPSSPFPPSTGNIDHAHKTDHKTATARYEYNLGTPSRASDSDPFGFVAVERALKAKRVVPTQVPRISIAKSPPRSAVLASHPPAFASFTQLEAPMPTNNEDIEGLYADEPMAGPSHVHVPVAPLLMMSSDQPFADVDVAALQPTFPDPLRTPRKRKRHTSLTADGNRDPDEEGSDAPSSPSPVKVSVDTRHRRSSPIRPSDTPVLKLTRAQTRAAGAGAIKPSHKQPPRTKRVRSSHQHIPTPSSTPVSMHRSSRQSTAPPTPVPRRRSTRQAAVGARVRLKGTTTTSDEENDGRMRLRSRSAKVNVETKSTKPSTRAKPPPKTKSASATQKSVIVTTKPARGRPKRKPSTRDTKSTKRKGKTRPLENVLDLSDDTREKYEKDRRERVEYFKRLEGYQIQKENVYVV